jgi:hypothetical protein
MTKKILARGEAATAIGFVNDAAQVFRVCVRTPTCGDCVVPTFRRTLWNQRDARTEGGRYTNQKPDSDADYSDPVVFQHVQESRLGDGITLRLLRLAMPQSTSLAP